MLEFASLAVFILATTRQHNFRTYLQSRILPIVQTWGNYFPHLYFVFGTNEQDYQYLARKCYRVNESYYGSDFNEYNDMTLMGISNYDIQYIVSKLFIYIYF